MTMSDSWQSLLLETRVAVKYVPDTDPDHEFILPRRKKRNGNSVTVKVSDVVIYVCLMGFDFISADPRIVGNDLPKNSVWKPERENEVGPWLCLFLPSSRSARHSHCEMKRPPKEKVDVQLSPK